MNIILATVAAIVIAFGGLAVGFFLSPYPKHEPLVGPDEGAIEVDTEELPVADALHFEAAVIIEEEHDAHQQWLQGLIAAARAYAKVRGFANDELNGFCADLFRATKVKGNEYLMANPEELGVALWFNDTAWIFLDGEGQYVAWSCTHGLVMGEVVMPDPKPENTQPWSWFDQQAILGLLMDNSDATEEEEAPLTVH